MPERKRSKKLEGPVSSMLTTREVACIFNVHPNTIRQWSKLGKIKGHRVGPRGVLKFRREEVAVLYLDRAIQQYLKDKSA
jgi:excisionase family DNA binding protein